MTKLPSYECPFRLGDTVIPIEPAEDDVNRPPFWVDEMEEYLGRKQKWFASIPCPIFTSYDSTSAKITTGVTRG